MSEIFLYASRAVMPLLLMILLGYLLRLGNFWDDSFFRQLNRFCFRVFLPVQLFLPLFPLPVQGSLLFLCKVHRLRLQVVFYLRHLQPLVLHLR